MEDKKRTRILGIMCKGIAISLLVLYVSLAFFSFFIRFSFVCSFVSSYLVVFRPVWSYLVLFVSLPGLLESLPAPPGPPRANSWREPNKRKKGKVVRFRNEWNTNGTRMDSTNGYFYLK